MGRWSNDHLFSLPVLTALVTLGASIIGTSVHSQPNPEFTRQILAQLDTLKTRLEANGYVEEMSQIDEMGLQENESRTWDLVLSPNVDYVITAVCDDDCQFIDLAILEDTTILAQNQEVTPYPMITGRFNNSRYRVTITMGACSIEPCYAGLQVFRQQ